MATVNATIQVEITAHPLAFEACKRGNSMGECVLAEGHEKHQGVHISDRPMENHIDRWGTHWNVGATAVLS
jgi:hypothetical protein